MLQPLACLGSTNEHRQGTAAWKPKGGRKRQGQAQALTVIAALISEHAPRPAADSRHTIPNSASCSAIPVAGSA